jgi:Subtilase family
MTAPQRPQFPANSRPLADRLKDLQKVYAQVGRINRRQNNLAVRRTLTRQLQIRHTKRPGGPPVVEFDVVLDRQADEVPVVPEELLVRADVADSNRGRNLISAYRLQEISRCLDNRLVRLAARDARGAMLADHARALTELGVTAWISYVVPTGVVWKGLGGPELSSGPGPERPLTPKGPVRVAVIDTGITRQARADGWLTDVVRNTNIDELDVLPTPDGLLDLAAGHGTFAAGIVQQLASDADIVVYRTLDTDGIASEVDVAEAMVRAVRDDGAQILNLSLGIETLDDQPPAALATALDLIHEYEAANNKQVLLVAAAGNFGHDRPCWPGAFDSVTAVAALTQALAPAEWSSRGAWVDCSTIGEGVRSTYVEGKESTLIDAEPDTFGPNAWALWSGTSFTAPQVAGAVARIAHRDGVSVWEALATLLNGQPELPGYGRTVEILPRI